MNVDEQRPFGPVIEYPHEGALISEHPINLMASGNYNKVPVMMGFTNREGMLMEIGIKRIYGKMKMFTDFEKKIPYFYKLKRGTELSKRVAAMIKEAYYGDEEPSLDKMDQYYLVSSALRKCNVGCRSCKDNFISVRDGRPFPQRNLRRTKPNGVNDERTHLLVQDVP